MEIFDCVIIGSGMAGMTAAIYLKRSNKNILLLEKSVPGGQINRTAMIENYPGFQMIDGPTLALQTYNQVLHLEVPTRYGSVLEIKDFGDYKVVKTDLEEIEAKTILIASGRVPRELGLENEKPLTGRGISYCAICDGPLYKNKEVAVVGGGNSAFEETLFLADICSHVYLIHRRVEFRADQILVEKLKQKENVTFLLSSEVTKLLEEEHQLIGIEVTSKNGTTSLSVSGVFVYIGYVPDTNFLKESEVSLDHGYILVNTSMKTNVPYIYAAGDVIKKEFYQISTAVGEAATAALTIKKDLE